MRTFYPYVYTWGCHSCGEELVLVVCKEEDASRKPEDRYVKWVRSTNLRWGREMKVGEGLSYPTPAIDKDGKPTAKMMPRMFECSKCLTEYYFDDVLTIAKEIRGSRGDKDAKSKSK